MPLREAAKYTNLSTTAFLWRFSCDGAARPSATPSRQRRAGVNEDTAETSVLRGLARLNRPNLADSISHKGYLESTVFVLHKVLCTGRHTNDVMLFSLNSRNSFAPAMRAEGHHRPCSPQCGITPSPVALVCYSTWDSVYATSWSCDKDDTVLPSGPRTQTAAASRNCLVRK